VSSSILDVVQDDLPGAELVDHRQRLAERRP
jgi:hypothetical protein